MTHLRTRLPTPGLIGSRISNAARTAPDAVVRRYRWTIFDEPVMPSKFGPSAELTEELAKLHSLWTDMT